MIDEQKYIRANVFRMKTKYFVRSSWRRETYVRARALLNANKHQLCFSVFLVRFLFVFRFIEGVGDLECEFQFVAGGVIGEIATAPLKIIMFCNVIMTCPSVGANISCVLISWNYSVSFITFPRRTGRD